MKRLKLDLIKFLSRYFMVCIGIAYNLEEFFKIYCLKSLRQKQGRAKLALHAF